MKKDRVRTGEERRPIMGQVSTLDAGEVEKVPAPATGLSTLWPSLIKLEREMEPRRRSGAR
jgi:hypothetical protein